ncbi:MAG TPA: YdeI/OmpD-associated family protein [Nonomuraea sp.]|nr:YdeI/OmpD-associated family protein [Nonomuraea sp.]
MNCGRAEELIAAGTVRPAGLAQIEEAKADGRWEAAYASQKTATVPDDLQAALDADPAAAEFFATLDSKNRYAILYRVGDAKKPPTRAAQIEKFVAMLREHKKIYP